MTKEKTNRTDPRFILSGGGTGGHLFPAIAIANELKREFPEASFLFVGAMGRIEMDKVPIAGYPIEGLWISGFQRGNLLKNITLPLKLLKSFYKAKKLIHQFKPDIVIGTGGYASFPVLYVASGKGIPTLIQEQNFFPGITNKWLSKKVDRVCTVFSGMEKYFPEEKIAITGNPVRDEIKPGVMNREEACRRFQLDPSKKTLLVVGGSLGARTLNESILATIEQIKAKGIQLIWQSGRSFEERLKLCSIESTPGFWAETFIEDMAAAYIAADVVVSRAGAISLSELAIMEKAVILVPSPNVTEDHQTKNALSLVKENAAILVKDEDAPKELIERVFMLMENEESRIELIRNIKGFAKVEATKLIVSEIKNLIGR